MHAARRSARGVSLVEAMVALAVMAFGTLAVLGVQTTLRLNADVAQQRNEAVRLAQQELEITRGFSTLAAYQAIPAGTTTTTVAGVSTSFQVTRTVVDAEAQAADVAPAAVPRRKSVVIDVGWTDRAGQAQAVRLSSSVQGTAPELAGSLSVPADVAITRNPGGRHPGIPLGAVPYGQGTSKYAPPGGGGVGWVFNNVSGVITLRCIADVCTAFDARLLTGYVNFATSAALQPTGADAEVPPGVVQAVDVVVDQTHPLPQAGTVGCYEEVLTTVTTAYYCAVPVGTETAWSGRSLVLGLPLALDLADADDMKFRICRYTPHREHRAVGPDPATQMRNAEHPLDYVDVEAALLNQNFLVIRAGDGVAAFDCPDDDAATPYVNGRTWRHQPAV